MPWPAQPACPASEQARKGRHADVRRTWPARPRNPAPLRETATSIRCAIRRIPGSRWSSMPCMGRDRMGTVAAGRVRRCRWRAGTGHRTGPASIDPDDLVALNRGLLHHMSFADARDRRSGPLDLRLLAQATSLAQEVKRSHSARRSAARSDAPAGPRWTRPGSGRSWTGSPRTTELSNMRPVLEVQPV